MVGINRAQQLSNFIRSLHEQGILDHNFDYLESLQIDGNPLSLSQIIAAFFRDAEEKIEEMTTNMSDAVVNFAKLDSASHHLKGCCSSIGACRVVHAVQELRGACDDRNKEGCMSSLGRVKQEYVTLRDNLNWICEIERANHADEIRRRHR